MALELLNNPRHNLDEAALRHGHTGLSAAIFLPLGVTPTACNARSQVWGAGAVPPTSKMGEMASFFCYSAFQSYILCNSE